MRAARLDISTDQGSNFRYHLHYKYKGGTGLDLSNITGEMQVRRTPNDDKILLYLSNSGITGGGATGDFSYGGGIAGVGGISFNVDTDGVSSLTGGIFISIDKTTMKNCPSGRHFYDLELTTQFGDTARLIEGMFEVARETTRAG